MMQKIDDYLTKEIKLAVGQNVEIADFNIDFEFSKITILFKIT
jgi:hypothetical protein